MFSLSNPHHENVSYYICFISSLLSLLINARKHNLMQLIFQQNVVHKKKESLAESGRKWKVLQTNPLKYFKRNYIKFPPCFRPAWNHLTTASHVRSTIHENLNVSFLSQKMFSLPLKLTFLDLRVFRFKNKILMTRLYKCKTFCSVLKPFKALFCSKLNHKSYSKLKNWKNLQP